MSDLLLAGDIGGTKANLVLVDGAGDPRQPVFAARLATGEFDSLEALLESFLQKAGTRARRICIGVPAPVIDGHIAPVNLRWQAQEQEVARQLRADQVRFLNDLVATALGIPELVGDEIVTLHPGAPRARGPKAVIAPGTGLGTGYLAHDGTRYLALSGEGGHADFAPRGERQRRLHAFLADQRGQTHVEAVCSGRGIANLWRFFGAEGLRDAPEVEATAVEAADPTPIVMRAARDPRTNPRSAATADEFVAILLQEAGNAAVRLMTSGGVYLAGGVPPKVLDWLKQPQALASFLSSPTMGRVLRETPVHVVVNEETAVLGAIATGRTL